MEEYLSLDPAEANEHIQFTYVIYETRCEWYTRNGELGEGVTASEPNILVLVSSPRKTPRPKNAYTSLKLKFKLKLIFQDASQ